MDLFDVAMVSFSVLGGLWVTFRMRTIDPRTRLLSAIVGVTVVGIALYQGLHGQPPLSNAQAIGPTSPPEALSSAARVLLHAMPLFVSVLVAIAAVVVFYGALSMLRERNLGVLRRRMPTTLRNAIAVGLYLFAAILPMSLEKHHVLHLTDQTAHRAMVAYELLIVVLVFLAMVLALDKAVRRHKAAVIAFFCGVVVVAGSSPFIGAVLAKGMPAAQPIAILFVLAAGAPGPAYFVLRYQLGWL